MTRRDATTPCAPAYPDNLDAIAAGNLHDMGLTASPPPPHNAPPLPPLRRDPCLLFAALPALAWAALTIAGY